MSDESKLRAIIAKYANCNDPNLINMDQTLKDVYVATEYKDNFANEICGTWPKTNCTYVHNEMFNKLKTGNNILGIL